MNPIRKLFHNAQPHFHKGGKYAKYYPFFEAFETFLFMPSNKTKKGTHVRDALDTKRYMSIVILALKPVLLFGIYNTGLQAQLAAGLSTDIMTCLWVGVQVVLPILIVTYAVGLGIEFAFAIVRGHEINEGFLVTGILYALILPPQLPLWMVGVGIAFGVIIGKEVFGGSGRNFLNPALTARAFLFFTYPAFMSGDQVWTYFAVAKDKLVDGFSGATALAVAAMAEQGTSAEQALIDAGFTLEKLFLGFVSGSIGETSTLCILLGAGLLLITKVGSWRTMLGCVIGAVGMTLILNQIAGPTVLPFLALGPQWHIVMGGFAFGAVFMATDPVSSPHTEAGKWPYGILIGALAIIIRVINPAYPEGMMLAILLMNIFAPLFDHMVIQRRLKKRIPNVI
jgi:Na+-transporting NADH:ubiquinone oxidoreductase subunit B